MIINPVFQWYSHDIPMKSPFSAAFSSRGMKTPGMNPRQDGTCSAEDAAEGAQRFSGPHVDQTNEETISCGHDVYNMGYSYIHLRLVYHIHYIHYISIISIISSIISIIYIYILIGGLEHFSIYWEWMSSSQLTSLFFRGIGIPPSSIRCGYDMGYSWDVYMLYVFTYHRIYQELTSSIW